MITIEDIQWPPQRPKEAIISLAFGIDGEIVHTLVTYVKFYNLIVNSDKIVCKSDNCDIVDFLDKQENIIETLYANPLLGSILASSPKIFILSQRSEDNSKLINSGKHPWYRNVEPGWKYDESGILPL